MEKFISFCRKAFLYPLQLRQTHPVTAYSVTATTLLFAVYTFIMATLDYNDDREFMELFFCICMSALYFSVFSLCIESIRFKRYKKIKYAAFAVLGALSLLMGFIMSEFSQGYVTVSGIRRSFCTSRGLWQCPLYLRSISHTATKSGWDSTNMC